MEKEKATRREQEAKQMIPGMKQPQIRVEELSPQWGSIWWNVIATWSEMDNKDSIDIAKNTKWILWWVYFIKNINEITVIEFMF